MKTIILITLLSGNIVAETEFSSMSECLSAKTEIVMQNADAVCTYRDNAKSDKFSDMLKLFERLIEKSREETTKGQCV